MLPITRKLKGIYLPGNIFWFRQGTERSERWSALPGTCIRKAWRSQVLLAQTNSKKQQDPDWGSASSEQDAITGIQGRSPLWAWHPARLFLLCSRDWVLKIRGYAECGGVVWRCGFLHLGGRAGPVFPGDEGPAGPEQLPLFLRGHRPDPYRALLSFSACLRHRGRAASVGGMALPRQGPAETAGRPLDRDLCRRPLWRLLAPAQVKSIACHQVLDERAARNPPGGGPVLSGMAWRLRGGKPHAGLRSRRLFVARR